MGFLDIFKVSQFKNELEQLKQQNFELQQKLNSLSFDDYDSAQKAIHQLEPTAEFNKTMLAEEFRQSQSSKENYISEYFLDEDDE